ncbi:hypothetical protein [Caballeronia sp. GAWG1-1]|uniref:hypothetical protein n=1 Tax=Caballeronia sp. GAWG1-1 TaxID=2921742 RepID=UPI002028ACF7|nr:hypothetical protein [Caballeronia sp. GAWG1-1]
MTPIKFSQALAIDLRRLASSIDSIEASLYLEQQQMDATHRLALRAAEETQREAGQVATWLMSQAEMLDAPLSIGDEAEFLVRRTAARASLHMCTALFQTLVVRLLDVVHRLPEQDSQRDSIYALVSSLSFALHETLALNEAAGLVTYGDEVLITGLSKAAESCTPGQGKPVRAVLDHAAEALKGGQS